MEDYTHMFDDAPSKAAWHELTTALTQVGQEVARRNAMNENRRRPFLSFATERIETAVSI